MNFSKFSHNPHCRDDRPNSTYWAEDPVRGHLIVRGQLNVVMEVRINE